MQFDFTEVLQYSPASENFKYINEILSESLENIQKLENYLISLYIGIKDAKYEIEVELKDFTFFFQYLDNREMLISLVKRFLRNLESLYCIDELCYHYNDVKSNISQKNSYCEPIIGEYLKKMCDKKINFLNKTS